jgi:SAM-dependent methyltransferase
MIEVFFLILSLLLSYFLAIVTGSNWPLALPIITFIFLLPGFLAVIWAPFVPTFKKRAREMIDLAEIKPGMKVYDLGAGDGRLVRMSASCGAQSYGYEISLVLVAYARIKGILAGSKGRVYWGDFWGKDFSDADIIFCYLYPHTMQKFEKDIYSTLQKGTKVISNTFPIHKLKPVKEIDKIYIYIKE